VPPSQSTSRDWWPHDGEPYPLIDSLEDGAVEERCWAPVKSVDGDEYAEQRAIGGRHAAILAFLHKHLDEEIRRLRDDGLGLELADGTTWQRPRATPDGYGYWVGITEDPCDDHEGDDCETCKGTGKLHLTHEGCPWESCKPTDEGAVEFYVLEVVDAD
jgi:hypothetical protein